MTRANFTEHEIDALLSGKPFAIRSARRPSHPRTLAVFLALAAMPCAARANNAQLGLLYALKPTLMRDQGGACQQIADAGDSRMANACFNRLRNSFHYLVGRATAKDVPARLWSACGEIIDDNLALGARCIAAAHWMMQNLRGSRSERSFHAMNIIVSGAWVYNPAAARLDLDTPTPKK